MLDKRIENFEKLKSSMPEILAAARMIKEAHARKNKVLFFGNGGSASDSNHLAAEFIARFKKERKSLGAISLCDNNSIITAIANDYSFEKVFSRQIEGIGQAGDIAFAISTSGKSKNIIEGIKQAQKQGLKTILLTGENKSNLNVDLEINAPSSITCEIQEMHIAIGHIICEMAD